MGLFVFAVFFDLDLEPRPRAPTSTTESVEILAQALSCSFFPEKLRSRIHDDARRDFGHGLRDSLAAHRVHHGGHGHLADNAFLVANEVASRRVFGRRE